MKKYSYRKILIILFMLNLAAIAAFYIKYCSLFDNLSAIHHKNAVGHRGRAQVMGCLLYTSRCV